MTVKYAYFYGFLHKFPVAWIKFISEILGDLKNVIIKNIILSLSLTNLTI